MHGSRGSTKRFVIAGVPRTGSSLIAMTLDLHPSVRCFGELFHPSAEARRRHHFVSSDASGTAICWDESDPISFLDRRVWQVSSDLAIGFKLFATHVLPGPTEDLFGRLHREVPDLLVIHSHRPNYLEVWASLQRAEQTGIWAVPAGAPEPASPEPEPVAVTPQDLEDFFVLMESADNLIAGFHTPSRYLRIVHDELEQHFESAATRIWSFLGVEPIRVEPPLVRQARSSPRSLLLNHASLAAHFRSTRFAWFFGQT